MAEQNRKADAGFPSCKDPAQKPERCEYVGDVSTSMLERLAQCSLPKGHPGMHRYIPRRGW